MKKRGDSEETMCVSMGVCVCFRGPLVKKETIIHDCSFCKSKQKTIILININQCLSTKEQPLMCDLQLRLSSWC